MLCSCGKKEATIHVTEIVNSEVKELHLCDLCAKEQGTDFKQFLAPLQAALPDLTHAFTKALGLTPVGRDQKCSACGMTMTDFEKTGRLGCGNCYKDFAVYLLPLVKKIQRYDQHQGKTPAKVGVSKKEEKVSDLAQLRKRLNECIRDEAYENAAQLRDEIKKYEKLQKPKKA